MSELTSRTAFHELIELLGEVDDRFLGDEWHVGDDDAPHGYRLVMHVLQSALYTHFEGDPERPSWNRIVSPTRKFTGDNADAVYFEAPIRGDRAYRITGNLAGAVYTSFTIEADAEDGKYASRTAGIFNDGDLDVDADGNYELILGGPEQPGNWMALPPDAGRISSRHYFERPAPAAADQSLHIPLTIDPVDDPGPAEPWSDASAAAAISRVINHLRGKTIDGPTPGHHTPDWVGKVANVLPPAEPPGNMAFAAIDAAYTMTTFQLEPDEALVMTGRWPDCRFGNVCIWNRFGQTLDYRHRSVSLNRANTELEADGSFRMVLAHRDPGAALGPAGNWLDTEGLSHGTIFWRFFLPEGDITPIGTEVVKLPVMTTT